jgi:hypothetical protein
MLWSQDLSLFSPQVIGQRQHRGLLIQFLLFEIIQAHKAVVSGKWDCLVTTHPRFFPYDWGSMTGYLNKLQEHSLLLKKSFSNKSEAVKNFEKTMCREMKIFAKKRNLSKERLEQALKKIYTSLEPLIEFCKENENLLLFMLKNRHEIDALTQKGHLRDFVFKIHPCGLETLGEKMCDQYHRRGFFSQIPEFKFLLTQLAYA